MFSILVLDLVYKYNMKETIHNPYIHIVLTRRCILHLLVRGCNGHSFDFLLSTPFWNLSCLSPVRDHFIPREIWGKMTCLFYDSKGCSIIIWKLLRATYSAKAWIPPYHIITNTWNLSIIIHLYCWHW